MDGEKLKVNVGNNISTYRKKAELTQAGLAEKLNYTDKAVSKWERGESLPDVPTLIQMAELFDVTLNDLLSDGETSEIDAKPAKKKKKRKADRGIILKLSSLLCWFVALLVYVILSSTGIRGSWVSFVYAIPVNAIVLLSLRSAWRNFSWNPVLISVIVWGSLLSIYVTILVFAHVNVWKIFLLGVPGQIAVIWWFRMFRVASQEENDG